MFNFFRNLFGLSIKSQVMSVIAAKIDAAQKAYNAEVKVLKENLRDEKFRLIEELDEALKDLNYNHNESKIAVADKHVNSILSKII